MVYKKKYGKKRQYKKDMAPKTKRNVRKLVDEMLKDKVEMKYKDNSTFALAGGAAITPTPTVPGTLITAIPRGTGDNERIGDVIRLISFKVFLRLWQPNDGSITSQETNLVRFIMVQWHSNTVPNASDILTYPTLEAVISPFKVDTNKLYTVVVDKLIPVTAQGSNGSRIFTANLKYVRKKLKFDGPAATTPLSENLFFWIICNDAAGGGVTLNPPFYSLRTRLLYADM